MLFSFCFLISTGAAQILPANTPASDDFLYAQKLFNEGYYDLSISQLRLFMQRYPDARETAEAWRLMGEANLALRQFAAAREAYETFEIRYPAHPAIEQVQLRLAESFEKQGDYQSAAFNYQRFVFFHPKSEKAPEAQYRAAVMWLRTGDQDKAREALYRLLEDYPGSDYRLPGHLLLVQSFESSGDTKRALEEAERLIRSFPQNDLTPQAYFTRARLQEAVGQFQLAESGYLELVARFVPAGEGKKSVATRPSAPAPNEWTSQAYARLAELANARGDLAGAVSFLDKAETLAPNSAAKNILVLRRAEMLAEMNDFSRALQSLEKFDQADPDSVHKLIYLHTIGRLQENLHNDATAAEAYRQATLLPPAAEIRSDSTNPQYRRQRSFWRGATTLFRLQKYYEALSLSRAYRAEYPDGNFRDAVLMLEADIQREGLNDYSTALRLYQELLEKFPQSRFVDDAQWAVADTYERMGEKRLASLEWQRLLRIYPASEHFSGAQCRLRLLEEFAPGDTPESMAKLTELILSLSRNRQNISTTDLGLRLAQLHFERREFQQAIIYCKQALQQQEGSNLPSAKSQQEAFLLLATCYFKLGEQDRLRNECAANGRSQTALRAAWFDSASISLRQLIQNPAGIDDAALAARAGALLAHMAFPPMSPTSEDVPAMPRTPAMLSRVDSTLAWFAEDSDFDYLRVWAAQTRKRLHAANFAAPSTARKLLLAEVDSLENERIVISLQKIAAANDSPWKNRALLELADWYWLRRDSANAVRTMAQLQNSPVKDPNIAIGQLQLAKWLAQRKNYDLALDQLATIQKRDFYSAIADSAALLRVRLLMAANRYGEALREMQEAESRGQRANRAFSLAGRELPVYEELDLTRARAAEATSDYPLAIRSYLRFLQTHPQAPEAAAVLLNAANLTRKVGATQLAIGYYEECVQRFPNTPEAREAKLNWADLRYDAEDYEGARTLFLELMSEVPAGEKVPPTKWEGRARKGAILCLYKLNKAGLAENEIKTFKSRFPDDRASLAEMQYAAGELAIAEKNFPEAEKIFKKLRSDYRDTPSAIYGDYGLGKALIIQNKFDEALDVLTEIPRRYPKHSFLPTVYIGLGDFYQSQQQWDNAITAFTKVIQDSA
ncbi:MAG: tetratricopeptide repeat protein, partial [candidate division KSB1 bacterium]|nr:tetratricopeptide repeat protein [candidate division KSB1 bacterium]